MADNRGDYRNLAGEDVHDGDVVTPPLEEQDRQMKNAQRKIERAAGEDRNRRPSEDKSKGWEGPGTQEGIHQ